MIWFSGLKGTFLILNPGDRPSSVKAANFKYVHDQGNRDLGDATSAHYLMNG